MRALIWLLVHWPSTVALVEAERRLMAELDLRAKQAAVSLPSPNQLFARWRRRRD